MLTMTHQVSHDFALGHGIALDVVVGPCVAVGHGVADCQGVGRHGVVGHVVDCDVGHGVVVDDDDFDEPY